MSAAMGTDDGEDVQDFLKRIRELGDQRDREDEERTRRLEQEILQGRKERQARREERARSLSPDKDIPSRTPTLRSRNEQAVMDNESKTTIPSLPQSVQHTENDASEPQKSNVPLRNGTSSYNHAPSSPQPPSSGVYPSASRDATSSDPISGSQQQRSLPSTVRGSSSSSPDIDRKLETRGESWNLPTSHADATTSRDKIAQSLGAKDPAWFRQTQDRGLNSAAFRRTQEEERSEVDLRKSGIGLPGMSKPISHSNPDPQTSASRSSTFSTEDGSSETSKHPSSNAASFRGGARSPLVSNSAQKLDPPSSTGSTGNDGPVPVTRNYAMSPSQRGLSPERQNRPPSPTKGLGGFVQSAMMKRSDSVSKRWSTQPTAGLGRPESVLSNRSGTDSMAAGAFGSLGEPSPAGISRECTPASIHSRPTSSQSNATITPQSGSKDGLQPAKNPQNSEKESVTDAAVDRSRPSSKDSNLESVTSPPTSPSKRWSPQKSSWLEKAINKPDSPKVLSPAQPSQQPSWMADIARAKQQRGSVDMPKGTTHKEITTSGLMRAPPPATGFKPPSITGTGETKRSSRLGSSNDLQLPKATGKSVDNSLPASKSLGHMTMDVNRKFDSASDADTATTAKESNPAGSVGRSTSSEKATVSPPTKPKPQFPTTKSTGSNSSAAETERKNEPEFKNVFGSLKPTKTQKYKAPDELKDNIMRGKAGLNLTGGPKKSDLKDEFKESILKKKQGMTVPSASTKISGAAMSSAEASLPEALRKRQAMKRSDSVNSTSSANPAPTAKGVDDEKAKQTNTKRSENLIREQPTPSVQAKPKNGLGIDFASSLSGILQRGPPPANSETKDTPQSKNDDNVTSKPRDISIESSSNGNQQLTHATKGRARGPKRKPPAKGQQVDKADAVSSPGLPSTKTQSDDLQSNEPKQSTLDNELHKKTEIRPLQNITNSNNNNRKSSQPPTPRKPSSSVAQPPKAPTTASQESPTRVVSSKTPIDHTDSKTNSVAPIVGKTISSPIPSPKKTPTSKMESPIRKTPTDPETISSGSKSLQGPRSPPLPRKPATFAHSNRTPKSVDPSSPSKSNARPHLDVAQLLSDVFDDPPNGKAPIKFDTQSILDDASSTSSFPKIKTLRKQIFEITDNGKMTPVPSHQEHILFEDSLYLCSHVFGTAAGQRMTEVYLWCGDGVSLSAVDDAQIFAKRHARESGGPLIVLQQGKETSSFFQALGGIVITRTGSSGSSSLGKSGSPYMLRGRQHIGQISFDEADFHALNLCSGFPYILSNESGKLYLWKGKGASADEIGCARLIGMDLGDIEEMDEGQETKDFWSSVFETPNRPVTDAASPHWHLKSSTDKYHLRLFNVDTEAPRPKSSSSFMQWGRRGSTPAPTPEAGPLNAVIKEIIPFAQADLKEEGVVVLDAFFEIFVIHTSQSLKPAPHHRSRQSASFRAAMLFAQEYAILTASADDRPSVPQVKVALFGNGVADGGSDPVPETLGCAFRKWDAKRFGTCRVLALPDCLEAMGVSRQG